MNPGSSNMHPSVEVAPPDTSVAHTHCASCFLQPGCSTGPQHLACTEKFASQGSNPCATSGCCSGSMPVYTVIECFLLNQGN